VRPSRSNALWPRCVAPLAPVMAIIGGPAPLGLRLISAVILVALVFVRRPASLPSRPTAIKRPRGLRAHPERLPTGKRNADPPGPRLRALSKARSLDKQPTTKGVAWVSANGQTRVKSGEH
jgi:hypothetical protein